MRYQLVLLASLLAFVALSSSTTTAQIQNQDCVNARIWHLQQAMKVGQDHDYHLDAASAASQLSTMAGSPCQNWQKWANPADPNGGWTAP